MMGCQVVEPAFFQVVVDEVLQQHLVYRGPVGFARKIPDVADQHTKSPMQLKTLLANLRERLDGNGSVL